VNFVNLEKAQWQRKESANIPLAPAAMSKARCGAINEALRRAAGAGRAGKSKVASRLLRSDSQRRGRKESAYRRKKGENNRSLQATTDWLKPEASVGRLELFNSALRRLFVRPPANDRRAVPKTASGKMVVGDFNDKLRTYGDPFGRSLRRPTTRRTRRAPGEAPFRPSLSVRSLFSAAFIPDVKPTWCSKPSSS
jgi:hypothetical protein